MNQGQDVRVSTLHALALRALRAAGLLTAYPADPLVLDTWEQEEIFDAEFGIAGNITKKKRQKEIRWHHEAFWSTGQWGPPNYIPPTPPITPQEQSTFESFHSARTQVYSCVLPGEIVRQCVDQIIAGILDPVALLHLDHIIVDEFQDLYPYDLRFIDQLIAFGARAFVAGDDDQSIYAFRYALPRGIQNFPHVHAGCGQHTLNDCFRCTPAVIASAHSLITANAAPNRIPKNLTSLYAAAAPPLQGSVYYWRFSNEGAEARTIAESCKALIQSGWVPNQIMILLSNVPALANTITKALDQCNILHIPPRTEALTDSPLGRWVLALTRIVCNPNDYVAHRTLLGLRHGVGIKTCAKIASIVTMNNLNFRDIFYHPLPAGVFSGRMLAALNDARTLSATLHQWQSSDTMAMRTPDIHAMVHAALSPQEAAEWSNFVGNLPPGMTIEELRAYLWADGDIAQERVLNNVRERLGEPVSTAVSLEDHVRIMTMHGAKGLSAQAIFIPGLEGSLLPGSYRSPYPGLVLEAARLLYVSMTRARLACFLSYTCGRIVNGQCKSQIASRFCAQLGGTFTHRNGGLSATEVQALMQTLPHL